MTGNLLEPIEEVLIDVDEEYSGTVVQKMSERKAEMVELRPVRRQSRPDGVLRADTRPHRLPVGAFDRYARHRDHEPAVPRL